jgi:phenylpropionate dioxygenase-like ring-hydroxylating dioxygenase large terminal subunit
MKNYTNFPIFLLHKNCILENHYHVLEQFDKKKVIVYSDEYKLISNICPHQKSLISTKDGEGNRICPYHSWSFTIDGSPLTSGRTHSYCRNEIPLDNEKVYEWNSLLFNVKLDFKHHSDFNNLMLMEKRIDIVDSNFKNIMDLFLDVDHIQSIHTGVYDLIGIDNTEVRWEFYENGSIQIVDQGALWISVYPFTMIEWQRGSLFITVAVPITESSTRVHVYKYVDKSSLDSWKLNEHVWETAWRQDRNQAEIITEFSKNNLEPQKIHYRKYLENNGIN